MCASLSALTEVASREPRAYKNLVPSFVSILKQVVENKLPRSYEYHKAPAPFIQVCPPPGPSRSGPSTAFCSQGPDSCIPARLRMVHHGPHSCRFPGIGAGLWAWCEPLR